MPLMAIIRVTVVDNTNYSHQGHQGYDLGDGGYDDVSRG